MKYRILYIMLFLFAFLFPSVAQNSYIEYEYVDGTKESNIIDMERMSFKYCHNEGLTYRITDIYIENIFDTLTPMDIARNVSRKQIFDILHLYYIDGEPIGLSGPLSAVSMAYNRLDIYEFKSEVDTKNGIMAVLFKSIKLPGYAYHNGKQISSISGRISYSRDKTIPSTTVNDDLKETLKHFCLTPILLKGISDVSYIKFVFPSVKLVSPSYDEITEKIKFNDLSLERVNLINNLKRMGYSLTSQKGVFPLTYQNQDGNTILVYETNIMVKVKD